MKRRSERQSSQTGCYSRVEGGGLGPPTPLPPPPRREKRDVLSSRRSSLEAPDFEESGRRVYASCPALTLFCERPGGSVRSGRELLIGVSSPDVTLAKKTKRKKKRKHLRSCLSEPEPDSECQWNLTDSDCGSEGGAAEWVSMTPRTDPVEPGAGNSATWKSLSDKS